MEIKDAILKTIYWFDLFDRPLELPEVYQLLIGEKTDLDSVRRNIRKMIGKELGRKGNLYFLKGRNELVEIYKQRKKISQKKWKKAKMVAMLLRVLPFVKAVFVTQNLAINNTKENSDIDFLIITSKNRLWSARAIINLKLDFLGLRNPENKSRICPNFFMADTKWNLKEIALKPQDIYLSFWLNTARPIFGKDLYKRFKNANKNISFLMPNNKEPDVNPLKSNWLLWFIQKIGEIILYLPAAFLEDKLKDRQIRIIEKNKKKAKNPSIVINDFMAKIHYDDKRKYYRDEWEKLYNKIS